MDPEYVALEAGELGPEPRVYHQVRPLARFETDRAQSHFWCAECGDPFLDPKCAYISSAAPRIAFGKLRSAALTSQRRPPIRSWRPLSLSLAIRKRSLFSSS